MKSCQKLPGLSANYHVMADALYWKDEIPEALDDFSGNCLRFILRYRTSFVNSKEDKKWREYWNRAKQCFPDWIGFSEERCAPNQDLSAIYKRFRCEADGDLPEI